MTEYRISFDQKYVIETHTRMRGQRAVNKWFTAVKAILFAGLAALLALLLYVAVVPMQGRSAGMFALALFPAFLMFLMALGPRIDYFFMARRFRTSPFHGADTSIVVTDSGVSVRTPLSHLTLSWKAYTGAARLADGYLLTLDRRLYVWWPDAALVAGSKEQVDDILRAHLASYAG